MQSRGSEEKLQICRVGEGRKNIDMQRVGKGRKNIDRRGSEEKEERNEKVQQLKEGYGRRGVI